MNKGQTLNIAVHSDSFNPQIMFDQNDTLLSSGLPSSRCELTFSKTGTYSLRVTSTEEQPFGNYALSAIITPVKRLDVNTVEGQRQLLLYQ